MSSDFSVFDAVIEALDGSKAAFDSAAGSSRELEQRHTELLAEEAEVLLDLAKLYLPELSPEAVAGGLQELRDTLTLSLEQQEARAAELEAEAARLAVRITDREEMVRKADAEEKSAADCVRELEARVSTVLGSTSEYGDQCAEHESVAERADRMKRLRDNLLTLSQAEEPRYEANEIFRFLEGRRFGEEDYRTGPVGRVLDRWLARLIDYPTLTHNYRLLKLGPSQINTQVELLTQQAADLEKSLERLTDEVAEAEGLPALLVEHESKRALLAEEGTHLDTVRGTLQSVEGELRDTEMQRGQHHEQAVELHRALLADKTLLELEDISSATPDLRDDRLVGRLAEVRTALESVEDQLEGQLGSLRNAGGRVTRLSKLEQTAQRQFSSTVVQVSHEFDLESIQEFTETILSDADEIQLKDPYLAELYRNLSAQYHAEFGSAEVVETEDADET